MITIARYSSHEPFLATGNANMAETDSMLVYGESYNRTQ
jgi:hypothetical protein